MNKKAVYKLVEQKGLKMSFLVDKSGVSRKSFYDYLNGRIATPIDVLLNISNTLNVSMDAVKA